MNLSSFNSKRRWVLVLLNCIRKISMEVSWGSDGFLILVIFGILIRVCNGALTSSYVRGDDLSLDMPLDSDVFRVPPGYNAPQQVCSKSIFC